MGKNVAGKTLKASMEIATGKRGINKKQFDIQKPM